MERLSVARDESEDSTRIKNLDADQRAAEISPPSKSAKLERAGVSRVQELKVQIGETLTQIAKAERVRPEQCCCVSSTHSCLPGPEAAGGRGEAVHCEQRHRGTDQLVRDVVAEDDITSIVST
jgi:hypothetical protein